MLQVSHTLTRTHPNICMCGVYARECVGRQTATRPLAQIVKTPCCKKDKNRYKHYQIEQSDTQKVRLEGRLRMGIGKECFSVCSLNLADMIRLNQTRPADPTIPGPTL